MQAHVLGLRADELQIAGAVVEPVPVAVVNDLALTQFALELLLRNVPVLVDPPVLHPHLDVAVLDPLVSVRAAGTIAPAARVAGPARRGRVALQEGVEASACGAVTHQDRSAAESIRAGESADEDVSEALPFHRT